MTAETLPREIMSINPEGNGVCAPHEPKDSVPPQQPGRIAIGATMYPAEWKDYAHCIPNADRKPKIDPELFFPVSAKGASVLQIEQAKAICAPCPVRDACLKTAFEGGEVGIWGGMTEEERRNMPLKVQQALLARVTIRKRISK